MIAASVCAGNVIRAYGADELATVFRQMPRLSALGTEDAGLHPGCLRSSAVDISFRVATCMHTGHSFALSGSTIPGNVLEGLTNLVELNLAGTPHWRDGGTSSITPSAKVLTGDMHVVPCMQFTVSSRPGIVIDDVGGTDVLQLMPRWPNLKSLNLASLYPCTHVPVLCAEVFIESSASFPIPLRPSSLFIPILLGRLIVDDRRGRIEQARQIGLLTDALSALPQLETLNLSGM